MESRPSNPSADRELSAYLAGRCQRLLQIAAAVERRDNPAGTLTRPLLADLLAQASLTEELLDAYGAHANQLWHPFRTLVAAVRLFSTVRYELLHIKYSLPGYHLLHIEGRFEPATEEALALTGAVLRRACRRLVKMALAHGLGRTEPLEEDPAYAEALPGGRLAHDRQSRRLKTVGETVSRLATAFLDLAAQSDFVHAAAQARPEDHQSCIPEPVSEEALRHLEDRFHSLQSSYDTYVLETETEDLDARLPVLRGHISVVMHLLRTATWLCHYYQRHLQDDQAAAQAGLDALLDRQGLLRLLMTYSIAFASRFILSAKDLCQAMLKRYAAVGHIEVPVPRYRGFHVRPATLVAKVVGHYGSHVQMELDGETYDAGSPLEIFRANEKINAAKRWWLAREVSALPIVQRASHRCNLMVLVRRVILALAEKGVLVIYQQPLELPAKPSSAGGTVLERIAQELGRLQATGKIDIAAELTARFTGDQRVLHDIDLLARSGYGEDHFGNNVDLPKELSYLRRES